MPRLDAQIPESLDHITRPVAFKVLRDVAELTNIPSARIDAKGELASIALRNNQIGATGTEVNFGEDEKLRLQITEEFEESNYLTATASAENFTDVFTDRETGARITPLYVRSTMTLEVVFRAASRADAETWRNRIRNIFEDNHFATVHEVKYEFPIPATAINMTNMIHDLREKNAPYGQTYVEYLREKFSPKVGTSTQQDGTNPTFIVREIQKNITGRFAFDYESPEAERSGDANSFTAGFTYRFTYDKPIRVRIDYPNFVNNSVVPSKWRDGTDVNGKLAIDKTLIGGVYQKLTDEQANLLKRRGGWNIPSFDDWQPTNPLKDIAPIFRILLRVDPSKPTELLDLGKLGNFTLNPKVLEYMHDEGKMLFEYGHSAFYISYHRNDKRMDPKKLRLENNILYYDDLPLDMRDRHHVFIGVMHELSGLTDQDMTRLIRNGVVARTVLEALAPELNRLGRLPELQSGRINIHKYREAVEYISYTNPKYSAYGQVDRVIVGIFTIESWRK